MSKQRKKVAEWARLEPIKWKINDKHIKINGTVSKIVEEQLSFVDV